MSSSVFTGPLLAGNVLNDDGSGNLAGLGGSSGVSNVGFVQMVQPSEAANGLTTTAFTQAGTTSGTPLHIVIPAQSIITDIFVYVTAAFSAAATLSIGTSAASANELVSAIPNATLAVGQITCTPQMGTGGLTQVNNWLNTSATQDVQLYAKSSATGTGTFFVVVSYIQAGNSFVNGQYT
jgi:hypothetical protein